MPPRHEYRLRLADAVPDAEVPGEPGGIARHPATADCDALAALMLDAYLHTIDYDGETLADARDAIQSYFTDAELPALPECSWLYEVEGRLASACLVAEWPPRGCPLIAYVLTGAAWKGRALGRHVVQLSLASLRAAGYAEARAVITEGNLPSERLFARLGFVRLSDAA